MNLKQRHRGNIEQPHVRGRAEGGSPKCFSQACCSRCEVFGKPLLSLLIKRCLVGFG